MIVDVYKTRGRPARASADLVGGQAINPPMQCSLDLYASRDGEAPTPSNLTLG